MGAGYNFVFKEHSAAAYFAKCLVKGVDSLWLHEFSDAMVWDLEEFHHVLLQVEDEYLDYIGDCIISRWKIHHRRLDCFSTATNPVLWKQESDFTQGIRMAIEFVKEKRKQESEDAALYKRALELKQKGEEFLRNINNTPPPHFSPYDQTVTPLPATDDFSTLYPIDKQSEEVRKALTDKFLRLNLYGETANIIKNEIKPWIDKRAIKDWNVLRYVLRKHDIFLDNLSNRIFADFLNTILELKGEEALKFDTISQRKDAQISICQKIISEDLQRDSEELEKKLKPVLEKMAQSESESEKAA